MDEINEESIQEPLSPPPSEAPQKVPKPKGGWRPGSGRKPKDPTPASRQQEILDGVREAEKLSKLDSDAARKALADKLLSIAVKLAGAADTEYFARLLANTKTPALTTALGTVIDKMQVLTGKPTEILETRETISEVQQELARIRAEREALQQALNGNLKDESPAN